MTTFCDGTGSVAATPARYLGHYGAAVLAARHRIKVRLRGSVVVGIAAVVEVPSTLITERVEALPAADPLPPAAMPPDLSRPVATPPPDIEVVEPEVVRRSSAEDVRTAVALLERLPRAERAAWLPRLERNGYRYLAGAGEAGPPVRAALSLRLLHSASAALAPAHRFTSNALPAPR